LTPTTATLCPDGSNPTVPAAYPPIIYAESDPRAQGQNAALVQNFSQIVGIDFVRGTRDIMLVADSGSEGGACTAGLPCGGGVNFVTQSLGTPVGAINAYGPLAGATGGIVSVQNPDNDPADATPAGPRVPGTKMGAMFVEVDKCSGEPNTVRTVPGNVINQWVYYSDFNPSTVGATCIFRFKDTAAGPTPPTLVRCVGPEAMYHGLSMAPQANADGSALPRAWDGSASTTLKGCPAAGYVTPPAPGYACAAPGAASGARARAAGAGAGAAAVAAAAYAAVA